MRKHIFVQGSTGMYNICIRNMISQRTSPCLKSREDEIHIPKKIIKNIHPPKDPKNRRKIGWETKLRIKRKVRYQIAKQSRKKNRV